MFDQIPNRRITERRASFKDALVAIVCVAAGATEAFRKGGLDWETVVWTVIFILSVHSYWSRRHDEPWNPPLKDTPQSPASVGIERRS